MSEEKQLLQRHGVNERLNHWLVAIAFVLLMLSGLALFHPAFFFLTNLFGGGTWARILHPFIGVVMFVSFAALALKFWNDNRITDADREWARHMKDFLANRAQGLPEVGKFNYAQKMLFWVLAVVIPLLLLSGVIIWQPYFAPAFTIGFVRFAVVVHALAAFIAILAIIVHVYAAIWTPGSLRAMTRGTVTASWARHHHAAWYKQISKEGK